MDGKETMKRKAGEMNENVQPLEWEEMYSQKHEKKYWFNSKTGVSVWDDPIIVSQSKSYLVPPVVQGSSDTKEWEEKFSSSKNAKYWYNIRTGESTWTEPSEYTALSASLTSSTAPSTTASELLVYEQQQWKVNDSHFPRYTDDPEFNLQFYISMLKSERVRLSSAENVRVVFTLPSEVDTSLITRSVQEEQMLKTRLKLKRGDVVEDLPSFWEVRTIDSFVDELSQYKHCSLTVANTLVVT